MSLNKKSGHIMRDYWITLASEAQNGNVEAARDLLDEFAITVENIAGRRNPEMSWNGPIPWPLAEFFAKAFRQILKGADPGKALGLVGKTPGRRKGNATTHNLHAVAAAYFLLIRKGWKPEQANTALGDALGVDRATVYRARRTHEAYGDRKLIDDEILKVTMRPYVDRIAPLLKNRRTKKGKSRSRS